MNNFDYKNLCPFKWFVLENFPFIEEDFDAITNWQLFSNLGNELNKLINSTNTLGTQVENLTNYFNNLDVQDEIDNKLNEMAESGELTEIIAQYLQLAGLLCFNTVNDMKNATNLINGSFVKTFGKITYNDGYGNFYKVRNLLNTDVVDNINIIALNNPQLIAEKVYSSVETEVFSKKITILIGDSYGMGENGWASKYKIQNNLTEGVDVYTVSQGGYGFIGDNNTFLSELQSLENRIINKNLVDKIIVAGGWNDRGHLDDVENAIVAFMSYAKTTYSKAHVYCGMIANYSAINDVAGVLYWRATLQKSLLLKYKSIEKYGGSYLNGVECVLHIYDRFQNDNIHPTENGNIEIASAITQAVYNGTYNLMTPIEYIGINSTNYTLESNILDTTSFAFAINVFNNIVHIEYNGQINIDNISTTYSSLNLKVCQYTTDQKWFRYVDTNSRLSATFVVKYNGSNYKIIPGYLCFERDGYLHVRFRAESDLTNISEISVAPNNVTNNYLQFM